MWLFDTLLCLVIAGPALVWHATAQVGTSNVTCTTAQWTFNDKGQSPCLVAATLESPCTGGSLNVPPLSPGKGYSGPLSGMSNTCICSSVTYSMISACAACQGASFFGWNMWIANCLTSDISISSYPLPISSSISVPTWAYINVSVSGIWDPSAAQNNHSAGAADSSAAMPTSTSIPHSSSAHSPNVGAIAGGIVGGVVGLLLVLLAAVCLYRRRIRSSNVALVDQVVHEKNAFGDQTSPPPKLAAENNAFSTAQTIPPRLYDPSDPSTFPPTPRPSLPVYSSSGYAGSVITSPTPTGPFSPSSASPNPISEQHARHLSGGTNIPTVTESTQHGRNLSGGTTSSVMQQHAGGYNGIPEI
ncbi:hypothetical protein JB92DRAFT_3140622 [Gautieria morchelliformis]|nr:hypothetical protein JB92DRAFT_3140622 [Gautieria morchelliformis]